MAAMGLRVEEWMGGSAGVSAIRMLRRRGWDNSMNGSSCDSRTREVKSLQNVVVSYVTG